MGYHTLETEISQVTTVSQDRFFVILLAHLDLIQVYVTEMVYITFSIHGIILSAIFSPNYGEH